MKWKYNSICELGTIKQMKIVGKITLKNIETKREKIEKNHNYKESSSLN